MFSLIACIFGSALFYRCNQCVDTGLNKLGKLSFEIMDMFRFVQRRIHLCLKLMRSRF